MSLDINYGYHLRETVKGTLGEFSKIHEEFDEALEANERGETLLELCELADLIGAIEMYVKKYNMSLEDLIRMKNNTIRAFKSGSR